jgi:hypothetical protein
VPWNWLFKACLSFRIFFLLFLARHSLYIITVIMILSYILIWHFGLFVCMDFSSASLTWIRELFKVMLEHRFKAPCSLVTFHQNSGSVWSWGSHVSVDEDRGLPCYDTVRSYGWQHWLSVGLDGHCKNRIWPYSLIQCDIQMFVGSTAWSVYWSLKSQPRKEVSSMLNLFLFMMFYASATGCE